MVRIDEPRRQRNNALPVRGHEGRHLTLSRFIWSAVRLGVIGLWPGRSAVRLHLHSIFFVPTWVHRHATF